MIEMSVQVEECFYTFLVIKLPNSPCNNTRRVKIPDCGLCNNTRSVKIPIVVFVKIPEESKYQLWSL